jgi:hypothetical protein
VDGQYLICLLYRDYLLLASTSKTNQIYTVQACIPLSEIGIEEVDNGRGWYSVRKFLFARRI